MRKSSFNTLLVLICCLPLMVFFRGAALEVEAGQSAPSPRQVTNLDRGWQFSKSTNGIALGWEEVDLPHSWNTQDTIDGDFTYRKGEGLYRKHLDLEPRDGRRYFLRFEGANEKAWVKVNGVEVGSHRGGYTAFAFEITDHARHGDNLIEVRVDNSKDRDIMPLYCDYNFYGGIYRSAHLIETGDEAIAVTDFASPGVYISQKKVAPDLALIGLMARVSAIWADELELRFTVIDREGRVIETATAKPVRRWEWIEGETEMEISDPRLWNGVSDPYLYKVRAELLKNGEVVDRVDQPLGLRFYGVDADDGFFLNGSKYHVRGVNRHQDREGKANALSAADHEEDFAIMREMGVNAVRLAHYPQADYAYSICDREGILVWAELPFIGPTGDWTGVFLKSEAFRDNLKQQLTELIRQNYNHPSILFWGLFNELSPPGDPLALLEELNALAHREDPYRMTTAATHREDPYNDVSDLVCWNRYFGWYHGEAEDLGPWLDRQHREFPGRRLCVSEYGAGASVNQHSETNYKVSTTGPWHPENYQAYVHETAYALMSEREYLWGTFLWNMFDFSVVSRREGDRPNINDKGMVTFDRRQRKDAFYFYQANWTDKPMVHIANKRFAKRESRLIEIKVYSNADRVELMVNGRPTEMLAEGRGIHRASGVALEKGENLVEAAVVFEDGTRVTDVCKWTY